MGILARLSRWYTTPREPARFDARLAQYALEIALDEEGVREATGRNDGDRIDVYRRATGQPGGHGSWCAAFVSWCIWKAAKRLDLEIWFELSRGAKRLGKNIRRAGRALALPEPCAIIVWHSALRNAAPWQGHVGICVHYDSSTDTLVTIEGNKGNGVRAVTYRNGAWRKRLYLIATIAA